MSGATGAPAGGGGADGQGRSGTGPAPAAGAGGSTADASQGGTRTVTDARGPQYEPFAAGPLPGERSARQQSAQPYHPPQAYAPPAAAGGAQGGTAARKATARRPKQAASGAAGRTLPRTRKARLRVAKVDPWSVMKVSFLLAIALGICTVVASAVLWMVMDAMGVFSTVGGTISEATEGQKGTGFDLESFLSLPRVLGFTSIIAVINVVLATALATLGAFIYNLSAGFVGGVELTLAEDE
ncbi:DUF3566 domain-containing protein [Streptomyces sp. NPDC018031]|uniref:DUF3566 domain-containing protein n=1 Tax=Streptomyces sp. NPDC018031 TaxID=3365033 RepID=UPI0037B2BE76